MSLHNADAIPITTWYLEYGSAHSCVLHLRLLITKYQVKSKRYTVPLTLLSRGSCIMCDLVGLEPLPLGVGHA